LEVGELGHGDGVFAQRRAVLRHERPRRHHQRLAWEARKGGATDRKIKTESRRRNRKRSKKNNRLIEAEGECKTKAPSGRKVWVRTTAEREREKVKRGTD
jgi:hypothetical protein